MIGARAGAIGRRFRHTLVLVFALPGNGRADYELRDGDTVVFLGDSITAARTYGKIVEEGSSQSR